MTEPSQSSSHTERIYEMTDNGGSPYRVWYRAKPGLTMTVAECGTKRDAEMVVEALNGQRALRDIAERTDVAADFANAVVRLRWVHERATNAIQKVRGAS